jgi:hypothetical protein
MRYLRAFLVTLNLMRRGIKPAPVRHAELFAWMAQTRSLVDQTLGAADAAGLGSAQRKALKVRVDGRAVSMESVLAGVLYHAAEEYPYLMTRETELSLTAVKATNLNDVYALSRLAELPESAPLQAPMHTLKTHLEQIPESVNSAKS